MTTRKILETYNAARPLSSGDFLIPFNEGEVPSFVEVSKGRLCELGCMVYLGQDVAATDLFARFVDSGKLIPDVEKLLRDLDAYVEKLRQFKIGNIVKIESDSEATVGFRLKLVARTPAGEKRRLP